MGYSGPMGYGLRIPANQLGGWRGLWGVRGYGLFPIWVMRGSTVIVTYPATMCQVTLFQVFRALSTGSILASSVRTHLNLNATQTATRTES